MDKQCPVCDKTGWDYDHVDFSTGLTFCGSCIHDLRQYGYEHGLMKWKNGGFIFRSRKAFGQAIRAVRV